MKTALTLVLVLGMTPGVASAFCAWNDSQCRAQERQAEAAERQAKAIEQMQKELEYRNCLLEKRENPYKFCFRW